MFWVVLVCGIEDMALIREGVLVLHRESVSLTHIIPVFAEETFQFLCVIVRNRWQLYIYNNLDGVRPFRCFSLETLRRWSHGPVPWRLQKACVPFHLRWSGHADSCSVACFKPCHSSRPRQHRDQRTKTPFCPNLVFTTPPPRLFLSPENWLIEVFFW